MSFSLKILAINFLGLCLTKFKFALKGAPIFFRMSKVAIYTLPCLMPKPKKQAKPKPEKEIKIGLNKPMTFDGLMDELVKVKPPKNPRN